MTKKIKVGIYTRVSTQEQAAGGYSIGEQKERLEKYAEAHGWEVYKLYTDPGFSGSSIDRPGIQNLLKDIAKKKLDKIVVYKLDRLSRSQKDTLYLIEDVFKKNNVDFVSMNENFDTGTPLGIAMIGILSVFAQLERAQITERMKMGEQARVKEGNYHGGRPPIGYDFKDGGLAINPYEAMQIREAYEKIASGASLQSIVRDFKKYTHSKNPQGGEGRWSDRTLLKVLKNPIYNGKIVFNGEIFPGKHEAIIDDKLFETVQVIKNQTMAEYKKSSQKNTSLLGGILWCKTCGARYRWHAAGRNRPTYYGCYSVLNRGSSMAKSDKCHSKSWRSEKLEEAVLSQINDLVSNPGKTKALIVKQDTDEKVAILLDKIKGIDKQMGKLVELYQIDALDFEMLNSKLEKLNTQKKDLEEETEKIKKAVPAMSANDVKETLLSYKDFMKWATFEQKKTIVRSLIDGILVGSDSIEIHWKFQ